MVADGAFGGGQDSDLGGYLFQLLGPSDGFFGLDKRLAAFQSGSFQNQNEQEKTCAVSSLLSDLILEDGASFLLPKAVHYIHSILQKGILGTYSLSTFEIWLAQFSNFSDEKNYTLRTRLVGKNIPRESYQLYFPIGSGKRYPGVHYVTAHSSPDLDTTVASFWGFVDAFGARVADSAHLWNVPSGLPEGVVEIPLLFDSFFGPNLVEIIGKNRSLLALSAVELMGQRGGERLRGDALALQGADDRIEKAAILVDENGYFVGDLHHADVEMTQGLVMLFTGALRSFENSVSSELAALFSSAAMSDSKISESLKRLAALTVEGLAARSIQSKKQLTYLDLLVKRIFGLPGGISSRFSEFPLLTPFFEQLDGLHRVKTSSVSALFTLFSALLQQLSAATLGMQDFLCKLDICVSIKHEVFNRKSRAISYRAELEEIRSAIDEQSFLTVTHSDENGRAVPLGMVEARSLRKTQLGSVSLRDFSNREETKIPPYFEVISVIDHHKCAINASAPPVVYISDIQSACVLVAEIAFLLNDRYSSGGMTGAQIDAQINQLQNRLDSPLNQRLFQRLLQRKMNVQKGDYSIVKERELIEYGHFLYAILDDTDLLAKVSPRDLTVVASLINRMESLKRGSECEVVSFDDLPFDTAFTLKAAGRILQNQQMYSLYQKVYLAKEERAQNNLLTGAIFADTKEQNGCARVGQTKLFARNFPVYAKESAKLQTLFYKRAEKRAAEEPEIALYMHMVSTIRSADEVYSGNSPQSAHKDELWIWIPQSEQGVQRLKGFLSNFSRLNKLQDGELELLCLGPNGVKLAQIFAESFFEIPVEQRDEGLPIAIVRFKSGLLNSRKAMISPFLPRT